MAALAVAAIAAVPTAGASAAPARPDTPQAGAASTVTATWSLVGVINPVHTVSATTGLVLYGAYSFDPFGPAYATFNQHIMPASIDQLVEPYIRVPDGSPHTYRLRFHLSTTGTTSTQYQLTDQRGYQSTMTIADGDAPTVDFVVSVQVPTATWEPLTLRNISGDNWVFYSCEIDEQIG
jgi:hypothetical protein